MVAKSWTDIKNTRTTSDIPQASLKHLCKLKIKMEHQKKVTYYLKKDNILLIKLLQYIIYKQNGISEKKIGYTIQLFNHLDLEKKLVM